MRAASERPRPARVVAEEAVARAGPTRVQRPAATMTATRPDSARRSAACAPRSCGWSTRTWRCCAPSSPSSAARSAIIAGLGFAALTLALLTLVLVYVGTFLFLGEWLFGSMGWGILHGTLLAGALITAVVLNLAGGWMGAVRVAGSPSGS